MNIIYNSHLVNMSHRTKYKVFEPYYPADMLPHPITYHFYWITVKYVHTTLQGIISTELVLNRSTLLYKITYHFYWITVK